MEKLVPDPLIKNQNCVYLWINSLKCYKSLFLLYVQVEVYQDTLKLRYWSVAFILYKFFKKKQKEVWKQSPCHFLHDF